MDTYEAPQIQPMLAGRMTKFATAPATRALDRIAGCPVDDLAREFGSPLFAFDERKLRRQVGGLRDALREAWPDSRLAWSYKTNYLDGVCAAMHQEGSMAEVVSAMEYEKARRLGVPGREIVFNGPNKGPAILRRAVAEGALIHADHDEELGRLAAVAEERDEELAIGLRVNCDAGIEPRWSRFGFDLDAGGALAAAERLARGGRLRLRSLHCHIGTYILDPAAYGRVLAKLLAFARELRARFGWEIDTLDLGGGLPSRNRLKGVYLPPDLSVPAVEDYVDAIGDTLRAELRDGERPRLILEPGRYLIDEAGSLITTVVAAKRLPDGSQGYVLDAGVNLLYTAAWYRFRIHPEREHGGMPQPSVLYGPLCMNIDVVRDAIELPPLPVGARLIVAPVGAYTITQSMQFIEYRPAVVMVDQQGRPQLLREAEDLSDIVGRERLPPHLGDWAGREAEA